MVEAKNENLLDKLDNILINNILKDWNIRLIPLCISKVTQKTVYITEA